MLLGVLVALIKIAQLATVLPGVGAYALGVLIILLATIASTFDPRAIWTRVTWADGTVPPPVPTPAPRAVRRPGRPARAGAAP
jgi:paraquat-inducible protein A